jgi:hypothetical protein
MTDCADDAAVGVDLGCDCLQPRGGWVVDQCCVSSGGEEDAVLQDISTK